MAPGSRSTVNESPHPVHYMNPLHDDLVLQLPCSVLYLFVVSSRPDNVVARFALVLVANQR